MKLLIALFAVSLSVPSHAAPYFRLMDPSHIHQSAALLLDPNGVQPSVAVTDIAIITHSTADGSIMPVSCRATLCPPEDWVPLEIGGGGSLHAAVLHIGASVNVAPQLGALAFKSVSTSSPGWLQSVKAAALGQNGNGFRLGGGLLGNIVKDGVVQSAKETFPGQGVLDIIKQSGRISVGYSWVY